MMIFRGFWTMLGCMSLLNACGNQRVAKTVAVGPGPNAVEDADSTEVGAGFASDATLIDTPLNPSAALSLNVLVGGSNITQYQYSVRDGNTCEGDSFGDFQPISQRITDQLGSDGVKVLCVRGKTADGKFSSKVSSYTWTKDTLAPIASLSETPSRVSSEAALNVLVGGEKVTQYQHALVNSEQCSGARYFEFIPVSVRITDALHGEGPITLCVKAKDALGNVQAIPTAYTWVRNTAEPTAVISGQPANPSAANTLSIQIGGTSVASYQYALQNSSDCNNAVYSTVFFPITVAITDALTSDGAKTICVKGKSENGKVQSTPSSYTFIRDTVASIATLAGLPSNGSAAGNLNVAIGGDGVTEYQFALRDAANCDGSTYGEFVSAATAITAGISGEGQKILCVKGRDAAGNVQATPSSHGWVQAVPQATLSGTPASSSAVANLNVLVGGEGVTEYQFAVTNIKDIPEQDACAGAVYGDFFPVSARITANIEENGWKTLCVKGRNSAGTVQTVLTKYTWLATSPVATLVDFSASAYYGVLNVLVGGDGVTEYQFAVTNATNYCGGAVYGSFVSVATRITATIAGNGLKTLCVKGRNSIGLVQSGGILSRSWNQSGPQATLSDLPQSSYRGSLNVLVGGDGVTEYQFALTNAANSCDGAAYGSFVSVATRISGTYPPGPKTLCVKGKNTGTGSIQESVSLYSWTQLAPIGL